MNYDDEEKDITLLKPKDKESPKVKVYVRPKFKVLLYLLNSLTCKGKMDIKLNTMLLYNVYISVSIWLQLK